MNEAAVIELARETAFTALMLAAPALGVGLIVGIAVAIFQTITSVQEQTMTIVPKLFAVTATLLLTLPWMLSTLIDFTRRMFDGLRVFHG